MKTKLTIILAFQFFLSLNLYADFFSKLENKMKDPSTIQKEIGEFCEKKWTKRGVIDNEMRDYCIQVHGEALLSLGSNLKKWSDEIWVLELINYCGVKWTKRDVSDFTMIDYCLNNQYEGILDIKYLLNEEPRLKPLYDKCKEKWAVDRTMVVYCINKNKKNDTPLQNNATVKQSKEPPKETVNQIGKWYEGGTLHGATSSEWVNGTDQNRLATCADYLVQTKEGLAALTKLIFSEDQQFKTMSNIMVDCVNQLVRGSGTANSAAALCMVGAGLTLNKE